MHDERAICPARVKSVKIVKGELIACSHAHFTYVIPQFHNISNFPYGVELRLLVHNCLAMPCKLQHVGEYGLTSFQMARKFQSVDIRTIKNPRDPPSPHNWSVSSHGQA